MTTAEKSRKNEQGGYIMIAVIVFASISALMITSFMGLVSTSIKASREEGQREQAIEIAEAGSDYYRWHLAHAQQDFQDGTGHAGPYVHNYYDKDGDILGTFTLTITPPPVGSTIVTILSIGKVAANPAIQRKIETKLAIPSLAKYAVVANDNMRFGAGTEVFGPIQSNGGIHFDGLAHNVISSAQNQYVDPDTGVNEWGVYTQVSPADPHPNAQQAAHADVFQAGRQFPVPAVDFTGLTTNLAQIKTNAQTASGIYLASSGALGYHLVLKTNGSFDLYRVSSLQAAPNGCANDAGQANWGTWSIRAGGESFIRNYVFPSNGQVFVEDNAWVDGQINQSRITIASGKFPDNPATRTSITVNNNLTYTNYDGRDTLSLIAQADINVGMVSQDVLRIDGALIAQNGRAGRYYYSNSCSSYGTRTSLTLDGMIGTNLRYGFAYTDGTGYQTRSLIYDANLLYGPPPAFPLTSNQYSTISWREIK